MPRFMRPVWLLTAAIALVDAVWLPMSGLTLLASSLLVPLAAGTIAAMLAWFYATVRRDARIASLTRSAAELIAFTTAAGILSYLIATLNQPLLDEHLVSADRALGLDWLAMYRWLRLHRALNIAFVLAYNSVTAQIAILLLVLNFLGRTARSRELVRLFAATGMACILLSGPWPTGGAFYYFNIVPYHPYLRTFLALRDGTLGTIDLWQIQGVVQFPSFHTALAILCAYVCRGMPILFPLAVAIDLTVIAATPAIGGHHFADVWAGGALTIATILLMRRCGPAETGDG